MRFPIGWTRVREHEVGLVFEAGVFRRLLDPGRHPVLDPLLETRVEKVPVREPWLEHRDLEVIVRSGALGERARVLDLGDHERALVWIDGRLRAVLGPGLHAVWTVFHEVRAEVIDTRGVRFEHPELQVVLRAPGAAVHLQTAAVAPGAVGLLFQDGRHVATLPPGQHAFWRGEGDVKVVAFDLREQALDVSGQEIMTADRVTLRLNALVAYRVADPVRAATEVEDATQALYRQAQLALREVVGGRELDGLLAGKDAVAGELTAKLRARTEAFGVEVRALGIRDVILPGEMKEILNRVTEAKKAAEATLVTRREETAAIRSQANTARIFESNPTLMRLRELEVLEQVAGKANLTVVLGEGGLAERVVKLL